MVRTNKQKQNDKRYREKFNKEKQIFYSQVGIKCAICGSKKRLVCHRKSFEKHERIANLSRPKLLDEKISDYVRLCYPCHFGTHWVHKFFGLSWKQILNLLI